MSHPQIPRLLLPRFCSHEPKLVKISFAARPMYAPEGSVTKDTAVLCPACSRRLASMVGVDLSRAVDRAQRFLDIADALHYGAPAEDVQRIYHVDRSTAYRYRFTLYGKRVGPSPARWPVSLDRPTVEQALAAARSKR